MKLLTVLVTMVFLTACGSTWEGVKKDAKEIGHAIGEATESAGESLKDATE